MLSITSGQKASYCDGISRRGFLQLGAMSMGGLTLAQLLRAEAQAGIGSSHKAIINIHLGGGPSHQDMFDLKPNAPVEYRGEFNPISTNVPGFQICEHMPILAGMADKFAVIRSIVGAVNSHSNFQTHTGYSQRDLQNAGGRPALGSVVSKLHGPGPGGAPAFISYNGGEPGFLGAVHKPYRPQGGNLRLNGSMTAERLNNRTNLLAKLDRIRRDVDATGQMEALDAYTERAVSVVTSGRVADALDINKEPQEVQDRYTRDGRNFLLARRLIEAGVRVVSFNWGGWDTHGQNFTKLRDQLPKLDRAMSTLLSDLHARGLDKDVTVVMWGEFGRTPRVNNNAGRDHWNRVMMGFLAGGGMKTGQVIGETNREAGEAKDRPVHILEVFSTLYRNLGIDPTVTIPDNNGRPQYLTGSHKPVRELI